MELGGLSADETGTDGATNWREDEWEWELERDDGVGAQRGSSGLRSDATDTMVVKARLGCLAYPSLPLQLVERGRRGVNKEDCFPSLL